MTSFDRHPRRSVYEADRKSYPPKNAREIFEATVAKAAGEKVIIPSPHYLSAQNRNLRFAADMRLAREQEFPINDTRQQRRSRERPWKTRIR